MIMKKIIAFCILVMCALYAKAQNDIFTSVEDVPGNPVRILPGYINPYTYIMIDGKLKPVKKDKNHFHAINNNSYNVDKETYVYKKDQYLVLKGDGNIYFLKQSDSPQYLSMLRNESVWMNLIDELNSSYLYLDIEKGKQFHKYNSTECFDKLSRIKWRGHTFENENVYFNVEEMNNRGISENSFTIASSSLNSMKDVVFIHKDNISPYVTAYETRLAKEKREKEVRDSIINCRLRLAIARKDMTFGENGETKVYEGDTLAMYVYDDSIGKFVGRFHYENLLVSDDDIRFADAEYKNYEWKSANKDYLIQKKVEGQDDRFIIACDYDADRTKVWLADLKVKIKEYNDNIAYMRKHQIFITKASYNYDGDQFGMSYDIYNCFGKTIKYVAIKLACYNNVGDLQRDYFGYATKTVRGIGPIEPDEGGSYSWEKIFWDEYDVIKNCKITNITFTFKDGTTRSFSGIKNIASHFSSDAWD